MKTGGFLDKATGVVIMWLLLVSVVTMAIIAGPWWLVIPGIFLGLLVFTLVVGSYLGRKARENDGPN